MKISAKAEYACVALVELAVRHQRKLPTSLKIIAEQYGISQPFLMQIFMQLKGAGLVSSVRGAGGGYQLSRKPEKISIADIVDVIDGPPSLETALSALPESPIIRVIQGVWRDASEHERRILESTTLADVQRKAHETDVIFYQI
jgi:Rrf2 family cysteine metabolism transcriptional repressor